jgi:hypothetical protein
MADKTETVALNKGAEGADEVVTQTWVDLGDGTHAPKTVTTLNGEELEVISPVLVTSTAITGQITVTTAGTAVQGPDVPLPNGVFIKALAGNTGKVYVGNDGAGDVTSGNGYELEAGKAAPPIQVANLNELWFDAATNGDKFCWLKG